jgi:hypothetical protein
MLNFENARVLGLSVNNDFWGENFRFASKYEISVDGSIYNITNLSGVAPTWSGISGFDANNIDYTDIQLGGISFGSGRINLFEFKPGNDVQKKDYSANITVFREGNLNNLTGIYYSGVNFSNHGHLLEGFKENYDFSFQDGTYSSRKSINSKFCSGIAGVSPIQMSRDISENLLTTNPILGFTGIFPNGLNNVAARKIYSESYNLITNEVSISEGYDLENSLGNYSLKYGHSLTTDQNGITTITEKGDIRGLTPDYYSNAEYGFQLEGLNSFNRSNEIFNYHIKQPDFPLAPVHLSLRKEINKFEGTISYSVTYSNSPTLNQDFIWEYTHEITKSNAGCFFTVKEGGRILGIHPCTMIDDASPEVDAWENIIKPGIASRISSYYTEATTLTNSLKPVNTSLKKNPLAMEILYNQTYTDDPGYQIDGFRKIDVTVTDTYPTPVVNKFEVANVKELVQPAGIAKEGVRNISIKLVGNRGTDLSNYLAQAMRSMNSRVPTGDDIFIDGCNYSFNPIENEFTCNLVWKYIGEKAFEDILL